MSPAARITEQRRTRGELLYFDHRQIRCTAKQKAGCLVMSERIEHSPYRSSARHELIICHASGAATPSWSPRALHRTVEHIVLTMGQCKLCPGESHLQTQNRISLLLASFLLPSTSTKASPPAPSLLTNPLSLADSSVASKAPHPVMSSNGRILRGPKLSSLILTC